MKKIIAAFLLVVVAGGCSFYEGKTLSEYMDDPRSIIKDPHFAEYKERRDALELQYLNKEISYVDYVQRMNELDKKYNKEVKERNEKLSDFSE